MFTTEDCEKEIVESLGSGDPSFAPDEAVLVIVALLRGRSLCTQMSGIDCDTFRMCCELREVRSDSDGIVDSALLHCGRCEYAFIREGFFGRTRDCAHEPLAEGGLTTGYCNLTPLPRERPMAASEGVDGVDADRGRSSDSYECTVEKRDSDDCLGRALPARLGVVEACLELREREEPAEAGRLWLFDGIGGGRGKVGFEEALRSSCLRNAMVSEDAEEANELSEGLDTSDGLDIR